MKSTTLHVGNLPRSLTKDNLVRIFTGAGKVLRTVISTNENHKLYALIEMSSEKDAATAIDYLDGRDFDGVKLTVGFADLARHSSKYDAAYLKPASKQLHTGGNA